ncbi:hypothetical protein EZJ49_11540 [Bdellovibrio bacteriovorus]|uniref:hypothetical protein n=1 Tax=Bdellovibrio bacteriovorus TaxID=959 RepID=UPI0021CFDB94|nr:hypothetical protein [Bdellovibrio bacteriovorus]UXR63703.1 hypothetical protein EZJ49_11540 [Bdellovibrio bacteriovorus]
MKYLNGKTVFLFDGVGALLSLLLTGFILPHFSELLGVPRHILYCLALFPLLYSIFSLSCFFLATRTKLWMLKSIIAANTGYCLISALLIFTYPELTLWGRIVLAAEILVVLGVIAIEIKILRDVELTLQQDLP